MYSCKQILSERNEDWVQAVYINYGVRLSQACHCWPLFFKTLESGSISYYILHMMSTGFLIGVAESWDPSKNVDFYITNFVGIAFGERSLI